MARPKSAQTVYMTHPDRKNEDGERELIPVVQSAFDGHWKHQGYELADAEPISPTNTTTQPSKPKEKKGDDSQE